MDPYLVTRLSELMAISGRSFHIRETSGKNACLADRVQVYGTTELFAVTSGYPSFWWLDACKVVLKRD